MIQLELFDKPTNDDQYLDLPCAARISDPLTFGGVLVSNPRMETKILRLELASSLPMYEFAHRQMNRQIDGFIGPGKPSSSYKFDLEVVYRFRGCWISEIAPVQIGEDDPPTPMTVSVRADYVEKTAQII